MRSRIISLALVLATAACSGPPRIHLPGSVAIDPAMPPEATQVILSALDAWSAATGGIAVLHPTMQECSDAVELCILPTKPGEHSTVYMARTTITDTRGNWTVLDLDQIYAAAGVWGVTSDMALQDTTMHELGHAFGLHHGDGELMRPDWYGGGAVDAETLAHFQEIY